jgi:hypothetical protein
MLEGKNRKESLERPDRPRTPDRVGRQDERHLISRAHIGWLPFSGIY